MGNSNSSNSINKEFARYKDQLFNKVIVPHLYDDDVKYQNKDIFLKTEKYIREYFEQGGFEWTDSNREIVHSLVIKSDNVKRIEDSYINNFKWYLKYHIEWEPNSSIRFMIEHLIDQSIINRKRLSFYYAKLLLVKYYYNYFDLRNKGEDSRKKIIVNIISIYFYKYDFADLAENASYDLDKIINEAYLELKQFLVTDIDAKVFIRKFVTLSGFIALMSNNEKIHNQLSKSQYVSIFRDLIDSVEKAVKELQENNNKTNSVPDKNNITTDKERSKEKSLVKPTNQQSAKPAAQQSAKPAAQQPAKPAAQQPAKPAAQQPAKPAAQQPAKPAAQQPAKPAAQQPAKPAAQQPAKPAAQQPAKPAAQQPAKPAAQRPAKSAAQRPAKSAAQQPAKSAAQQPVKPTIQSLEKPSVTPHANTVINITEPIPEEARLRYFKGQTSTNVDKNINRENSMDIFLSKIGGKNKHVSDPLISLLQDSTDLISTTDSSNTNFDIQDGKTSLLFELMDEEIIDLQY